ncbi:MAG: serine protease [Planctomycetaceae bacterium]
MTFPLTKLYGATLWLMLPVLACGQALGDDLGDAVQAAIAKVEPSVVRLRVIGGEQAVDGDTVASLVTTGIVISKEGEILTSQFALEGNPEAVLVEDQFGKRTNATIVATDSVRRIVLLKAKEGLWTPAVPDDSRSVEVGQWSIAAGTILCGGVIQYLSGNYQCTESNPWNGNSDRRKGLTGQLWWSARSAERDDCGNSRPPVSARWWYFVIGDRVVRFRDWLCDSPQGRAGIGREAACRQKSETRKNRNPTDPDRRL